MSTPILTKKQQRHSLSAKKSAVKGLRNVLAQPQQNYWPVVKDDQCAELEKVLNEVMPVIKRPSAAIPWSKLRHMKKEERAQAKKEALVKKGAVQPDKNLMTLVVTGVNAVARSLEKKSVCCVLLDANVEPPLLIKHIIFMAQNKKIPVLLMPSLKSVALKCIGFSAAALALKDTVKEATDHHFYILYKKILDISKNFPLPKDLLHDLNDESPDSSILSQENTEPDETELGNEAANKSPPEKPFTISTNVYKYRTSRTERAFVPPTTAEPNQETENQDFIAFPDDPDEEMEPIKQQRYVSISKPTNKSHRKTPKKLRANGDVNLKRKGPDVEYLSLKIKRMQGNSNRSKATKIPRKKKK